MNPFSRVVTSLLEGQFICPVTDQEGYQYLTSTQLTNGRTNFEDIDLYLRRLDLRITLTRGAGAYFAAHADIDNEGKKAAKKRFTELKNILRPMVSFLEIVEPRARRIRALQLYLRRHPEYEVGTPDEYPEIPEWAYQHEPMKIRLEPDLGRQEIRDSLVDVAMSIEKAIPVPGKARGAGKLVTEEAPKAALIKGSPLVVVSQRLLNEAARATEQLSAAHYFAQAPETQVLDQESCMMCFLTLLEKQMKVNAKIIRRVAIMQVARNSDDFLSGNVIIEDVLLCKR